MTEQTPAVIYGAKSTEDKHGSIPTQIADCRAMAEREGWRVVGEYTDESKSAYHGDRGPGLAQAREHAATVASEEGGCVLVAQHSDRFARGDGLQAQHLAELWFAVRRQAVELRSVQDDSTFTNPLLIMALGERNTEDSRRKGEATKAGLRRRVVERGQSNAGCVFGYRTEVYVDGDGDAKTRLVVDEAEAATVRRVFSEYIAGRAQGTIARDLESEGVRTRTGGHWYASSIHSILTNPLHVGRVKNGDETFPGRHEAIVAEATWDAAQQLREGRHTHGGRPRGRRGVGTHLLTEGLLLCTCGSRMTPETRRREGSEVYRCARGKVHTGVCDAKPWPREVIDQAVFGYFTRVALDEDSARTDASAYVAREQADAEAHVIAAERELATADARLARVKRGWQDGVIDDAEYAEQRTELQAERSAAEAQLDQQRQRYDQIEAALAAIDVEKTIASEMAALRGLIAGQIQEGSRSGLDPARATLRRVFAAFQLCRVGKWPQREVEGHVWHGLSDDDDLLGVGPGYCLIPIVRSGAVTGLIDEGVGMPAIRRLALPIPFIYSQPTEGVTAA